MATNSTPLTVVGVNNGSVASGGGIRRVLITPLGQPGQVTTQVVPPVIDKVLLKAVAKSGPGKTRKEKTFTLRRINTAEVCTCDKLKKLIKKQLCDDVIAWEEFDVGYIHCKRGEKVVSIRSAEDLMEVWKESKAQGDKMQLWCDGLKSGQEQTRKKKIKQVNSDDDESEDEHLKKKSAREQRDDKLKQAVETLNEKHGSNYTPMQYHIWSELHANGMHTDLDKPPNNSMFKRAGANTPSTKKKQSDSTSPEMAQALTQAATQVSSAIVAAFTPQSAAVSGGPRASTSQTGISPAKIIDNRSKCYRQLTDLQNLLSEGLLSDEDYSREKEAIMGILKKLV